MNNLGSFLHSVFLTLSCIHNNLIGFFQTKMALVKLILPQLQATTEKLLEVKMFMLTIVKDA